MSTAWNGVDSELLRGERLGDICICSSNTRHIPRLWERTCPQLAIMAAQPVVKNKQKQASSVLSEPRRA
jgi:hypothetical protein